MRGWLRSGLCVLPLLAGSAALAQGDPDERVERRRTIAGSLVEDVAESDGGTLVRLSRRGRGYSFEYYLEFWRGNGGVVVGASLARGECRSGEASSIRPTEEAMLRAALDARLADYLAECPLPPRREAALRRALDAAWPTFSLWSREALAAVEAENQAIADHGRIP